MAGGMAFVTDPPSRIHLSDRRSMTPNALRVAARYRTAAVVLREPTTEVIFSDGGVLTANDLRRLLEPQLGALPKMRLRPALTGKPTTIAWEALSENAEFISGRVVLHAKVDDTRIVVWAEVLVDQRAVGIRIATALPKQFLEGRLRQIATKGRRLLDEVRVRPDVQAHEIVAELVASVEIAEGD